MEITRSTLKYYKSIAHKVITGYCSFNNLPNEKSKYIKLGSSYGKYGLNYTAYWDAESLILICWKH